MGSPGMSIVLHAIPTAILVIVGGGYAILKWGQHPKLSLMILVALGLAVVGPLIWYLFWESGEAVHRASYVTLSTYLYGLLGFAERALFVFAAFFGFHDGQRTGASHRSLG